MTKLKISPSQLVAIAAISLTISAQDVISKLKVTKKVTACYSVDIDVGIPALVVNPDDCKSSIIIENNKLCNKINTLNHKIFTNVSEATALDPAIACPGNNKYCCITYEIDNALCANVILEQKKYTLSNGSNYYRVAQVFCTLL